MAINFRSRRLEDVFTPGGQPSVTYVDRGHLGLEAALRKAIALPNTIVSLTGATKCGKTVLCRAVLLERSEFIWIDGGAIKDEADVWRVVCTELKLASEFTETDLSSGQGNVGVSGEISSGLPGNQTKIGLTIGGSALRSKQEVRKYLPDSTYQSIEFLLRERISLVIDDFHYLPDAVRLSFIQTIKGAVFRGLKVILLSTPHRAFEAIKAEAEITGRFRHVTVPAWSGEDLQIIATAGFSAMNVRVTGSDIGRFASEAEGSPLLMQRFCWNLCFDANIQHSPVLTHKIEGVDLSLIFDEVADDAGLPIYEKLAKGPQSRTDRIRRPLIGGGDADIYEATLLAVARTGPKEKLTYDQIRSSLNAILAEKIPQKLEVSNTLNHLAKIAADENKSQRALDWDGENLDLFITDPFFRFYLRWKIAGQHRGIGVL